MGKDDLIEELDLCQHSDVLIEINGVLHAVYEVQDTSQGAIIVVDSLEESRSMYALSCLSVA